LVSRPIRRQAPICSSIFGRDATDAVDCPAAKPGWSGARGALFSLARAAL
jgi:hypothetical protein